MIKPCKRPFLVIVMQNEQTAELVAEKLLSVRLGSIFLFGNY